jgi:hypothetical protein
VNNSGFRKTGIEQQTDAARSVPVYCDGLMRSRTCYQADLHLVRSTVHRGHAMISYYPCRVRLDDETRFVAWYTADLDGFLREPDGRLVVVGSVAALPVPLASAEPVGYDFDRIRAWCADPAAAKVDCRAFLDAWNFLDDLTGLHAEADTPYTRLSRTSADVYDKIFWANNLPAVTPPGQRFVPSWSWLELVTIRQLFESGLVVLADELRGSA